MESTAIPLVLADVNPASSTNHPPAASLDRRADSSDDDGDDLDDEQTVTTTTNATQGSKNTTSASSAVNRGPLTQEEMDRREANRKKKQQQKKRKRMQALADEETDYEVDIVKKSKTSGLIRCEQLPEHQRARYALIEANPWLLIVSNLPSQITNYEIKDYFNALITSLRPEFATPVPVLDVEIATSKQFATLLFKNKQAKIYTATLKNIEFQKCKLVIEKPRQYFYRMYLENSKVEEISFDINEGASGSMPMNKIYLGGMPLYLKDADVRKLCENFGKLKYFNVAKQHNENKEQVSKGYCFFEYEDGSVTDKAIKALNGLPCGDRKLKASRVSADQNKLANTQQLQNDKSKHAPSNQSGSYLGGCDLIKREEVQKMLTIPEYTSQPSRVIQLLNMVSIEDLFEEDIVSDLRQDIMSECEKIGPVERIEIPLPDAVTGECPPSIGKVFVRFKYLMKAKRARHVLSGRTYNRRTVIASFYPEDKFESKEYLQMTG